MEKIKLKCDICGTDVTKTIKRKRCDGKFVKKQNIGVIIHPESGKPIIRCINCYWKTYRKKRKKSSSYILLE